MAITLTISANSFKEQYVIPVSTNRFFIEKWLPYIDMLKLDIMKKMPCMILEKHSDINEFVKQLNIAKKTIECDVINDERASLIVSRINDILDAFNDCGNDNVKMVISG